jgi:predicted metalloprotease
MWLPSFQLYLTVPRGKLMRWEGNRESSNVEDVRGSGGGGGGFGLGGRSIGIGTIVIALVGGAIFGINPLTILGVLTGGGGPAPQVQQGPAPAPPANDPMARFVSTVLADTEDVWAQLFKQGGASYVNPKLVLFRGAVRTGCGQGQAAMGPFYCPADQKVYIDLDFYETLKTRLGAPGDFAQAYVIAAMNAAAKIGDDALQKGRGGAIVPESFTHGTSAQRQRWFNTGLTSGTVKACDTFSARSI